jgi:hypothetical protein
VLYPHPGLLGIALQKNLILLDLDFFFDIFYAKTIDLQHLAGHVTSGRLNAHIAQLEAKVKTRPSSPHALGYSFFSRDIALNHEKVLKGQKGKNKYS